MGSWEILDPDILSWSGILWILDPGILFLRGILGILDPEALELCGILGILKPRHCVGSWWILDLDFWPRHNPGRSLILLKYSNVMF